MLIFLHGSFGIWDEVLLFGGVVALILFLSLLPRFSSRMRAKRKRSDKPADEE